MNNCINRMKRYLKYIMLFALVSLYIPMRAQNCEQELKRMMDSVRMRDKEIAHLRDELNSMQHVMNNVRKLQELVMSSREKNVVLYDSIVGLHRTIDRFLFKIDGLRVENDSLHFYIARMEPLVKRQLAEMATTVDQKWLNKSYAEINKDELRDDLELYKAFKDKDKGVEAAYYKLSVFYDGFLLYLQGIRVVNSSYQADSVAQLITPMKGLKERETHVGRKLEIGALYTQLNDYKVTVMYCQEEIIGNIDKLLSSFKQDGTDKMAWKQIKHFLDTKDDGKVETYMNEIPWLAERYHEYLKQLEANPYGHNTARETIMKLIP